MSATPIDKDVLKLQAEMMRKEYGLKGFDFVSNIEKNHHVLYDPGGHLCWEARGLYTFKAILAGLRTFEVKR